MLRSLLLPTPFTAGLVAYRKHLWNFLMKYVAEDADRILETRRAALQMQRTKTRGPPFETMDTRRKKSIGANLLEVTLMPTAWGWESCLKN